MRKIYSLFVLLSGSILFGQDYTPMLQENHVWSVSHYHGEGNFTDHQYRLSDETLNFNGKEYIKLYITNDNWTHVYLHENVIEKKVYLYNPESMQEYLLYDFNLDVGDALPLNGFINYGGFEEATIVSITYENVFGIENVKTYNTVNGDFKIYEGIGADSGLFTLVGAIDDMYQLMDFHQEEEHYEPMLNPQNRWVVRYSVGSESSNHTIRINPLDVITHNNKEYIGLQWKYGNSEEWVNHDQVYLSENIEDKKVYVYYPSMNGNEYVLYDFNLELGETFHTDGFYPNNIDYELSIDSLEYQNHYGLENLKTYNLAGYSSSEFKIYEGIGSMYGLYTIDEFENHYRLVDFYRTTMDTNEENLKAKTAVYPNPFSDKIQIQNSEEIKELQLFDLQGKLISENKNLDELNSKLSSLNNAVYFLKINFKNNKSETIKVIKNK